MPKEKERGSTLIEVVVVAAILSAVSLAFLGTFALLSQTHPKNQFFIKGSLLAEEGMEAVRFIKSGGWSALSSVAPETDIYLAISASGWSSTSTPEIIDGIFYRSWRTHQVFRDASDEISSAGTVDPETLLIDVRVEWSFKGATTSASYKSYMTSI